MPLVIRAKMRKVMRDSEGVLNENDIALQALANALKNIVLDKEDKAWMAQERAKNEKWRKEKEDV